MSTNIPPLPLKAPLVDEQGFMTQAWVNWFTAEFQRIGGVRAMSNTEIEAELTDHETRITNLGG